MQQDSRYQPAPVVNVLLSALFCVVFARVTEGVSGGVTWNVSRPLRFGDPEVVEFVPNHVKNGLHNGMLRHLLLEHVSPERPERRSVICGRHHQPARVCHCPLDVGLLLFTNYAVMTIMNGRRGRGDRPLGQRIRHCSPARAGAEGGSRMFSFRWV